MFNRGSGSGIESKRVDESFYRGIVVKNNDPLKMNRVKVYIPELTNQPFEEWFADYDSIDVKMPGINSVDDTWNDTDIFEKISETIPWAEPCYPLFGESNNSRYFKDDKISIKTDCNYPNISSFGFSPAFLYENKDTVLGDAFSSPLDNLSVKCNSYAFGYKPMNLTNKTKGIMGIPEVGSKVWVFHYQGSTTLPIYFGISQNFINLNLINNTDNEFLISGDYPNDFEN